MPRKTKEQTDLENKDEPKKVANKKAKSTTSTAKKTTTKKTSTNKKNVLGDKETKPVKKRTTSSKTKKSSTTRRASSSTTKKTTTGKSTSKKKKETVKIEPVEYYDLPYRYNQTVVKVLAQTPTTLFIYWDISDEDRKRFEEQYGENFFESTKPILVVHNDTLGYSFEVEINDFARYVSTFPT